MASRHFEPEDGTEDAPGESVCGWNGSGTLYVPEHHQAAPCPPAVRERLAAAREQAAARHRQQQRKGLCL